MRMVLNVHCILLENLLITTASANAETIEEKNQILSRKKY